MSKSTLHADLTREELEDKLEDLEYEKRSLLENPPTAHDPDAKEDWDNLIWEIEHVERLLRRNTVV